MPEARVRLAYLRCFRDVADVQAVTTDELRGEVAMESDAVDLVRALDPVR